MCQSNQKIQSIGNTFTCDKHLALFFIFIQKKPDPFSKANFVVFFSTVVDLKLYKGVAITRMVANKMNKWLSKQKVSFKINSLFWMIFAVLIYKW